MFWWNIGSSREPAILRWLTKRGFNIFLKKKLGQFILGDIDLDQLDVQLGEGIIQLTDLALNLDYLNDKLSGVTPVIIKEGSIGSLLVKMPWKGKGLQVEVDELEIVLTFCSTTRCPPGEKSHSLGQAGNYQVPGEAEKLGDHVKDTAAKSSSADVHEGVRMIAMMVKRFLSSCHVKVKRVLIAFELHREEDGIREGSQRTLVFRISEIKWGTSFSEDGDMSSDEKVESVLGISRLTNFIKFRGGVLELLNIGNFDNQTWTSSVSGSSLTESFSEKCSSSTTHPIVNGRKEGLSGSLNLSIPWKDGLLDIHKLDADVNIDPVELILEPRTIKWFLHTWETYKSLDEDAVNILNYGSTDSVFFNSASHFYSSETFSNSSDKTTNISGGFLSSMSSFNGRESMNEGMLPGSHLIPDWVPNSLQESKKDSEQELDLGASVDQFFECFDGMRNSQSALGSSGMWNWTCSVFSALTAASSLASGSLHIASEQQHVQTNLKAAVVGISIILSFQDGDQDNWCGPWGTACYLGAECQDISVVLQVCPKDLSFEGTVKYIEVVDYSCDGNDDAKLFSGMNGRKSSNGTLMIRNLQTEVQDALPPFVLSKEDPDSDDLGVLIDTYFPQGNAIKIKLFSTSGVTHCQFITASDSSDGSSTGPASLSLQLPPFVFWVNLCLISRMLEVFKDIDKSIQVKCQRLRSSSTDEKHRSCHGDEEKGSPTVEKSSPAENFQCNIFVPKGRVILCFASRSGTDVGGYFTWDQFFALDIFTSSTLPKEKLQNTGLMPFSTLLKKYASGATQFLHLNVANLKIYLINATCQASGFQRQTFSSKEIVSVSNTWGYFSTLSMLWQEGHVTGPSIVETAKYLVTSEDCWDRKKCIVSEFVTVTMAKDVEDMNSQIREDIILSSARVVHVNLFPITIDICSSQYADLHCLLDQMINVFSCVTHDTNSDGEASSVSQTSILVECKSVELVIRPVVGADIRSSIQTELPGSWHCVKLNIQQFNLLSVSNIGDVNGASFFWLAHGEGKLWGSISGAPEQEFLLISCTKSTRNHGNGGPSNALSTRWAGSDIVHLRDPESFHDFTSIMVRCATLVAVGGRLDWFDAISCFFILSSPDVKAADDNLPKADWRTFFVLKLVDVGLSYEPYFQKSVVKDLPSKSFSLHSEENIGEPHVACLLVASSLILSNRHAGDDLDNDYNIRVQDLGLLLCLAHDNIGGTYSVDYLQEMGYAKVAQEALVEAVFRTNCKDGLLWEVECTKSHVCVETCHDTTTGLMHLAAQLQRLFAPDLEESAVHLQNHWNNVHHVQEGNEANEECRFHSDDPLMLASKLHATGVDTTNKLRVTGLMGEICEDAFHLDGNDTWQWDCSESEIHFPLDESILKGPSGLNIGTPDPFSGEQSFDESVPLLGAESSQTSFLHDSSFPEFIEGYCLSDLHPLSELSIGSQLSPELFKCRSKNYGEGELGRGNCGWYGDASLSIVENHISEASPDGVGQFLGDTMSSIDFGVPDTFGQATGRLCFKNMKVSWKMYAGSDWSAYEKKEGASKSTCGKDAATCLELSLSGMQFQYDSFPDGGISASKLSLSIQDFYLYDGSKPAPWKRVLGYYHAIDRPRETSSKAFRLLLESVRPDPSTPLEEYRLQIAFLPMLLHLQQSQLDFLISFFGRKSSPANCSEDHSGSSKPSATKTSDLGGHTVVDEALLPYFQKFKIWPILLRVDYHPQTVDLAALGGGKYVELINLVPWKGVELQLKHVEAVGVYGWGGVCETIIGEWLEDIARNQIHKVLQGLPTVRSLVAVGAGVTKLVSLPVESYRKDQKVIKGMQRGTIAFLRSISIEAVGLGVHLAAGAHDMLLQAEYHLTNVTPLSWPAQCRMKPNVRCNQPKDAQQGMKKAYDSLSDGLGKSATALVQTPLKKYLRGESAASALATAVQAVPAAAIAPISAWASAAYYALLGLRNSLDPEHKKESMEKYMGPTQPPDWN